jgi:hypothetical protein
MANINANTLLEYKEKSDEIMANPDKFQEVYNSYFSIGNNNVKIKPLQSIYDTKKDGFDGTDKLCKTFEKIITENPGKYFFSGRLKTVFNLPESFDPSIYSFDFQEMENHYEGGIQMTKIISGDDIIEEIKKLKGYKTKNVKELWKSILIKEKSKEEESKEEAQLLKTLQKNYKIYIPENKIIKTFSGIRQIKSELVPNFTKEKVNESELKKESIKYFEDSKNNYDTLNEEIKVKNAQSWIHSFNEGKPPEEYTSHANFYIKTTNDRLYRFNHYKFYITLSDTNEPEVTFYDKIYCNVNIKKKEDQISLKKLWQYAMCHWWLTNMSGIIDWPGSCTGFTDFLMFCVGSDNIFSRICKLTKNKKNSLVEEDIPKKPKKPKLNPKFKLKKSKSTKLKKSKSTKSLKKSKKSKESTKSLKKSKKSTKSKESTKSLKKSKKSTKSLKKSKKSKKSNLKF